MDRAIVYDAEQPRTVDFLNASKFYMMDSGYQQRGWIGDQLVNNRGWQGGTAVVSGLACLPTVPVSLAVTVGPGSVYTLATVDANPFGDLGTDSHQIVKQGINPTTQTIAITPPSQPGFSQVFLVEAQLLESDTGVTVLQYYNASNPFAPLLGPGGNNAAQPTVRALRCNIIVKPGVATSTGSEVAPAVDAGSVALYTIDVANGATQITGSNITKLDAIPTFPNLPAIPPALQDNSWTFAQDVGTVNALAAKILPPVTSLSAGIGVFVKCANTNTGAATFNLNGTGNVAIHRGNGSALSAGDINAGQVIALFYDGSVWQTLNFEGWTASSTNNNTINITIPYAQDVGPVNAMKGFFSPPITALAAGLLVTLRVANSNTGPATMQCDNTAAVPVISHGQPLFWRHVLKNEIVLMLYDGTSFVVVNTRWPYFSFDEGAAPATDMPIAVGDQVNITFSGVSTIPLNIATVPGIYELELIISSSNSTNTDWTLRPNNNVYGGRFDSYTMESSDYTGGNNPSTNVPASGPTYVARMPVIWALLGNGAANAAAGYEVSLDTFPMDVWLQTRSDWGSASFINDKGPTMIRITCSTFTNSKSIRAVSGIRGGPAESTTLWTDSTPWTSLGTLTCTQAGGGIYANFATVSGLAIVRRLA